MPSSPFQNPPPADLQAAGFDPRRAVRIGDTMQRLVRERRLPGMALRVSRRGALLDWSAGVAVDGVDTPFTASTLLRLFSMTKQMTSAVLFSLHEEGAWLFSDPITRFLPELSELIVGSTGAPPQRGITMADLLLHTAGFAYGIGDPHEIDRLYVQEKVLDFDEPIETLLQRVARLPLVAEPGTRLHYSVAHDLQGLIAQRIAGRPLDQLMRERLFEPVGMKDARFGVEGADVSRLAEVYRTDAHGRFEPCTDERDGVLRWSATPPPALVSGGGGVIASLEDEFRFLRMVADGGAAEGTRILAPATVRLMTAASQVPANGQPGARMTPGWWTLIDDPVPSGSCVAPGSLFTGGAGGNWGWIDPKQDLIVVGMMSVIGGFGGCDVPSWLFDPLIYQALDAA